MIEVELYLVYSTLMDVTRVSSPLHVNNFSSNAKMAGLVISAVLELDQLV
jgi:hypothetical protein